MTVRVIGELSRTTTTTLRAAVDKAAAECPAAVVVDLSGMSWSASARPSVFAAVILHAQEVWGVSVLLYGAAPDIHRRLSAFRSYVTMYADEKQALAAAVSHVPRWRRRHLAPVASSAAATRTLLDEACRTWGLPHLRDTARLIGTELVTNAVVHAGTDLEVTAALTRRYLRIAVQDGSTTAPHPPAPEARSERGRGLEAVEAFSAHWGVIRVPGGKIVWAMLGVGD